MGVDIIWGHGNRAVGWICSSGRKRPAPPCSVCGDEGELLCDGPGERKGRTCDVALCSRCAVSIRVADADYCPTCARGRHPDIGGGCAHGNTGPVRCEGPIVAKVGLCVHHAVVFDEWMGHHGGEAVYRDQRLSREAKRARFTSWLDALPRDELEGLLERRHLR